MAEKIPHRRIEDLILEPHISDTVREFVTEHHRADLLRSYNLEPRNRVLLTGPLEMVKLLLQRDWRMHLPFRSLLFVMKQ